MCVVRTVCTGQTFDQFYLAATLVFHQLNHYEHFVVR